MRSFVSYPVLLAHPSFVPPLCFFFVLFETMLLLCFKLAVLVFGHAFDSGTRPGWKVVPFSILFHVGMISGIVLDLCCNSIVGRIDVSIARKTMISIQCRNKS